MGLVCQPSDVSTTLCAHCSPRVYTRYKPIEKRAFHNVNVTMVTCSHSLDKVTYPVLDF